MAVSSQRVKCSGDDGGDCRASGDNAPQARAQTHTHTRTQPGGSVAKQLARSLARSLAFTRRPLPARPPTPAAPGGLHATGTAGAPKNRRLSPPLIGARWPEGARRGSFLYAKCTHRRPTYFASATIDSSECIIGGDLSNGLDGKALLANPSEGRMRQSHVSFVDASSHLNLAQAPQVSPEPGPHLQLENLRPEAGGPQRAPSRQS